MKKKCLFLALALMFSFPVVMTSCGDDEPDGGEVVNPGGSNDPEDPDNPGNENPDTPGNIDSEGSMHINGQDVSDAKIIVYNWYSNYPDVGSLTSFEYDVFTYDSKLYNFVFNIAGRKFVESSVGKNVTDDIIKIVFKPVSLVSAYDYYFDVLGGSVRVKAVSGERITLEFNRFKFSYWRDGAEDEAETYEVTGTATFRRDGSQ